MMLHEETDRERRQSLHSRIRDRAPLNLESVGNYLMTVDYLDLINSRNGEPPNTISFDSIAGLYRRGTGKDLEKPNIDTGGGASVSIRLPDGQLHGLEGISSGEREILAIAYFLRRFTVAGSVLLFDEPELHLHPALQATLFEMMSSSDMLGQVIAATHSPKLVAAVDPSSIYFVSRTYRKIKCRPSNQRDEPMSFKHSA